MNTYLIILLLVLLIIVIWYNYKNKTSKNELPIVLVDLEKYQGLWYEIARLPFYFENECVNPTATYTLNNNSTMNVTNKCYIANILNTVNGLAIPKYQPIKPNSTIYPGSFIVKLRQNPIGGDYNILYLDRDYQVALVGTIDRKYLWILSRTRVMDEIKFNFMINYAEGLGYNVNNLIIN